MKLKHLIKDLLTEIDDEKIIKYKDKDGNSAEMKAGSAKTMEKGHPAKIAWDKMSEKEQGGEKDKPAAGAVSFDRKADKADSNFKDDSVDDMEADMNDNEDAAMDYEENIENALLDSLGGDGDVEVSFDDFDTNGNPVYTVEIDGEDKEITVDQKTGEIYDYTEMHKKGFDSKSTAYGNVNESTLVYDTMNKKLKKIIQESTYLGELPSSKLMKMKWNPLTEEEDVADQDHKGSTDDLPPRDMALEQAPKMKREKWHDELDQATQSILRAERMLKFDQPGTHGKIKKSFLKTIKTLQQLKSDTRRF